MIDVALKGQVGDLKLDVTLRVAAQGITGLMGRSGSGKTTLLRAIAGLTRLKGHVRLGEQVWQAGRHFVPVHRRAIGYVFQEASLFDHLSVQGNLDFAGQRGQKTGDRAQIVELLQIGPLLRRSVGKLSGGERQRVAMARTLLSGPDILLMDEPLSSLDQSAKAEILPFIRAIAEVRRVPIIYVSHDPLELAQLTDRILYLSEGRLVAQSQEAATLEGLNQTQIEALARAALRAGIGI